MRYKKYLEYARETYYLKFKKGLLVTEEEVHNYYGVMSIDDNGEYIEDETVEAFIVKIPLEHSYVADIYMTANERLSTGFKLDKLDDYYELKFYNHAYAVHKVFYQLEKCKLLKIKKIIFKPKWENTSDFYEDMEIFPTYINPKGVWQCSYDLIVGIVQLGLQSLYKLIKIIRNKNRERKGEIKDVQN